MKRCQKRKGGTGNPPYFLLTDISLLKKQQELMKELSLNFAGFRDLITIYSHYSLLNTGLKVSHLIRTFDLADTNYRMTGERLNVLRSKGLIYMMGSYWYPTEKAIKILNDYKAL
jgi:hypothetical protein